MKGILEFDLNDFEDRESFNRANKALDMALALVEIREKLRNHEKYEAAPLDRGEFFNILEEHGINLEELVS